MAEIDPETILRAFSRVGVLVSMSIGPDGLNDSAGTPYSHIHSDSLDSFLGKIVDMADDHESVVVEFRQLPTIGHDMMVHAHFTMRESAFKR